MEVRDTESFKASSKSTLKQDHTSLVRDLHREWQRKGGKINKRFVHSNLYLSHKLQEFGVPVHNFSRKLSGRSSLSVDDSAILIKFFLLYWPTCVEGSLKYKKLFPLPVVVCISRMFSMKHNVRLASPYCERNFVEKTIIFIINIGFALTLLLIAWKAGVPITLPRL